MERMDHALEKRTLGTSGLEVSARGLGCMGPSYHRSATLDRNEAIALIRDAVDLGVTLFDTAQVYGPFTNEQLVGDADRVAVQEAIGRAGMTLVDVRSAAEYRGDCFWPSGGMEPGGRAGHVPSAVHQPIDGLHNADGSFRSAAELRGVFSPAVLDGGRELITYCTIGGRAATAWFVLTHLLGRDRVRVYDGSWAEWGRTPPHPSSAHRRFPGRRQRREPGPQVTDLRASVTTVTTNPARLYAEG
jgi:rhodanese-related sulfurtransferase